jgi:hypothetical protein
VILLSTWLTHNLRGSRVFRFCSVFPGFGPLE